MGMRTAGRLVLVLVLGSLAACDEQVGEVLHEAGADGPSSRDAGTATVLVGPSGGTFSFFGGKVVLQVPPGALTKDISLGAQIPKSYPADPQLVPGTVYDLLPDGTTFNKAVKLSITYDQASVPSGMTEAALRLHKEVSGGWAVVVGGGLDAKAHVAWAMLSGFSKYGVKGPSPATVDGLVDAGVDAAVPVDAAKPDVSDGPQLDVPKPVDLPKPDLPKPPDMPLPTDMPVQPDAPLPPDLSKPDLPVPPGMPLPPDLAVLLDTPVPPDAPLPDTFAPDTAAQPTCVIGGQTFNKGAVHPGGCAQCDPAKSTTSWTVTSSGCLIYNVCKKSGDKDLGGCSQCDPSKSKTAYTLLPGKCSIDGACHASGAKHPGGCGTCDPAKSTSTWTPSGNNCVIDHACFASGAKHSAGCGSCDPAKSQTDWTVSGNQCLIGSTCRASGAKEPGGCGVCDPTKSKTAWSRPAGCMVAHAWSKKLLRLKGMAVDGNGNIYITGGFSGSIDLGGSTLTSKNADVDAYLASFTPSGKHRWSMAFGGKGTDEGHDVAVDGSGNVTVTGIFATSISFGGGYIGDPGGKNDIFVASFTPSGKHRWSRGFFRSDPISETSIAADGAGNTYLTGIFEVYINFGGGYPSFDLKSKAKYKDMFLASFDSGGKHRWSKNFANPSTVSVCSSDVVVDNSGNTYVTGWFAGSVSFGGTVITSSGFEDVHLASFTSAGTHRWSKKLGGKAHDRGTAVVVDNNASVFVTGHFEKAGDLGGGVVKTNGGSDIFVAGYATSGTYRWSRVFGSSLADDGEGISKDKVGNVYVTGYFSNSVDFGGGKLSTKGAHEMFVVSLDPAGKHRWSRAYGSTWSDYGRLVENDDKGNIYLGAQFSQTIDLGGGALNFGKGSYALLKLLP